MWDTFPFTSCLLRQKEKFRFPSQRWNFPCCLVLPMKTNEEENLKSQRRKSTIEKSRRKMERFSKSSYSAGTSCKTIRDSFILYVFLIDFCFLNLKKKKHTFLTEFSSKFWVQVMIKMKVEDGIENRKLGCSNCIIHDLLFKLWKKKVNRQSGFNTKRITKIPFWFKNDLKSCFESANFSKCLCNGLKSSHLCIHVCFAAMIMMQIGSPFWWLSIQYF